MRRLPNQSEGVTVHLIFFWFFSVLGYIVYRTGGPVDNVFAFASVILLVNVVLFSISDFYDLLKAYLEHKLDKDRDKNKPL